MLEKSDGQCVACRLLPRPRRIHRKRRPREREGTRAAIPKEDPMSATNGRYGSLKRLWEAGSREVQRGLRVLLEGPPEPGAVTAPEELGPNNAERELDLALLQLKAKTCRNISDALDRVARGTFGVCEACSEKIPTARLR